MTAAAMATMATVEAATSTRRFYPRCKGAGVWARTDISNPAVPPTLGSFAFPDLAVRILFL